MDFKANLAKANLDLAINMPDNLKIMKGSAIALYCQSYLEILGKTQGGLKVLELKKISKSPQKLDHNVTKSN